MGELTVEHLRFLRSDEMLRVAFAVAEAAGTPVDAAGRASLEGLARVQVFESRAGAVSLAGRHRIIYGRDDEVDDYWHEASVTLSDGTVTITAGETWIKAGALAAPLAEVVRAEVARLCIANAVWRSHITIPAAWDAQGQALGLCSPGCAWQCARAGTSFVFHRRREAFFGVSMAAFGVPPVLATFGPWPTAALPHATIRPVITPLACEPDLAALLGAIALDRRVVVERDEALTTFGSASVDLEYVHDRSSLGVTEGHVTTLRAGALVLRSVACTASTRFGMFVVQHDDGAPLGLLVRWWQKAGAFESVVLAEGHDAARARDLVR